MTNEICVEVKNVDRAFGKKVVLQDVSLNVKKAEIYGLLGPSGAGKTTLVKCIGGIDEVTAGSIHVFGEKMPKLALMEKMGYMTQADALYEELTAMDNLQFFAEIYGLKGSKQKERIQKVMELVNLTDHLKKSISAYSGGMKRRLSLAISLLHEPEVIVLDEPTVGIDPVLRKSIWEELYRLSEQGKTIIVTTHVMDEAEKCHRLGMMRDGKMIAEGSPEELKKSVNATTIEEVFLAYGGGK